MEISDRYWKYLTLVLSFFDIVASEFVDEHDISAIKHVKEEPHSK